MKRILIFALIIISLISIFSLSCFAALETDSIENSVTESIEAQENIFETVYRELLSHSDKLLAALSFIGSLLVVFAYKKGLLPIIKASLGALGTAVSNMKEESERVGAEASTVAANAAEKLSAAEALICELGKKLDTVETRLAEATEKQLKGETVYSVMNTQIEMLYEVFMSSSLPAYQKESVGEKIAEMKRSLAGSSAEAVVGNDE